MNLFIDELQYQFGTQIVSYYSKLETIEQIILLNSKNIFKKNWNQIV